MVALTCRATRHYEISGLGWTSGTGILPVRCFRQEPERKFRLLGFQISNLKFEIWNLKFSIPSPIDTSP